MTTGQAQALADLLKDAVTAESPLGGLVGVGQEATPAVLPAGGWRAVDDLPAPWARWASGWTLYQVVRVAEGAGLEPWSGCSDVSMAPKPSRPRVPRMSSRVSQWA